jgi:hypothetical protein
MKALATAVVALQQGASELVCSGVFDLEDCVSRLLVQLYNALYLAGCLVLQATWMWDQNVLNIFNSR